MRFAPRKHLGQLALPGQMDRALETLRSLQFGKGSLLEDRPFHTPTTAEPLNRVQTAPRNPGLVSLGLQAPRPKLQTSPATQQQPRTEQEGGLGPSGLGRKRMGGTGAGKSKALLASKDQNLHSCGYRDRASPAPRLYTRSLPRPRNPLWPLTAPGVQFTTSPPPPTAGQGAPLPLPSRPKAGVGRGGAVLRVTGEGSPPPHPARMVETFSLG